MLQMLLQKLYHPVVEGDASVVTFVCVTTTTKIDSNADKTFNDRKKGWKNRLPTPFQKEK